MTLAVYVAVFLAVYALLAMTYVYAFRGDVRPESLREYTRKCWPMFAPLNCLLYLNSERRARRSMMDMAEFPELTELSAEWETIRDEAMALYQDRAFEQTTREGAQASYDIGFHTFFKYGWSKYYLKWYGYTHDSAKRTCPRTVELLQSIPSVKGAMFTLLPPGSKLTRHSDPFACSLRYHLGLATPNSDDCWISIDGTPYSWRDGEAMMFDETRLHHAANNTDSYRLILMCDVARPMNVFGRIVNFFYSGLLRHTVVPNDDGDRQGGASSIFAWVTPILNKGKVLKKRNRRLYKTIKHAINAVLVLLLAALIALAIYVPTEMFG